MPRCAWDPSKIDVNLCIVRGRKREFMPIDFHKIVLKVTFFRKYDAFFSLTQKCAKKNPEKETLNLRSVQSQLTLTALHCSIQGRRNSKYKTQDRTRHIFWAIEIITIFFQENLTFSVDHRSCNCLDPFLLSICTLVFYKIQTFTSLKYPA